MNPRQRTNLLVFCVLITTFLIWSNSFIAIGILKLKLTAMELVVLRFIPVGVISTVIVGIFYRRECVELIRRHPVRILTTGFLMVISYNFLLNFGMTYVKASASSLLVSLNPLFTLLLAVRILKEPYSTVRGVGTALSFAGLAVVVIWGRVGLQDSAVIPVSKLPYALLIVGAALSWAINTVLVKPMTVHFSPLAINYVSLAIGCLPLYFMPDQAFLRKVVQLTPVEIFSAAFLSLGCTVIAFAMWVFAVKHWSASNVSLFVFLNPPLTAIFSWFFLGHTITPFFFLGGSLMLAGIVLATARVDWRALLAFRHRDPS